MFIAKHKTLGPFITGSDALHGRRKLVKTFLWSPD